MEENKSKNRRKCIYCLKTIKKFTKSKDNPNRRVHRKCWLKNRSKEDRCYDYLFTERANSKNKVDIKSKTVYQSVVPTNQYKPVPLSQYQPLNQVLPPVKE